MESRIQLGTVADERRRKLLSILSDQTDLEQSILLGGVSNDPLLSGSESELMPTLEFIRAQDYGPRDLDRYYAAHPIRVARFLLEWSAARTGEFDPAQRRMQLQAGLVHNAFEKKILGEAEIRRRFGDWVAGAVSTITVDRTAMSTRAGVADYYRTLAGSDAGVRALKIFDKFDNLFVICLNPDAEVRTSYMLEIEEFLVPIIADTAPEILDYTRELLAAGRALGYFRPDPDEL